MTYFDSLRDPVDSSISDTYHWKSESSTGSSTTVFDDLTVPSSPNFPNSTAIRYMLHLPGEPYYDGVLAGTHPLIVKNVNSSTILSRISPNGTLTPNTYKIFPSNSVNKAYMEINVGIGSCQPNDIIAFDGYFITSALHAKDQNRLATYQLLKNKISGLNIGYNDVITPSVSPGYAHDITNGKRIYTSVPISQPLATGIDTGSTTQPNTFYYMWLIENTAGTVRLIYSLSNTGPILPSGYIYSSLIGVFRTNSVSHMIVDHWVRHGDQLETTFATPSYDRVLSGVGSTGRVICTLTAPENSMSKVLLNFKVNHILGYGTVWINYGETFETDIYPTGSSNAKFSIPVPSGELLESTLKYFSENIQVDSNRQIYVRVNSTNIGTDPNDTYFSVKTTGFYIDL
jgi:hypothetical protein